MGSDLYSKIPHPGLAADLILLLHGLTVLFVILGLVLIVLGGVRGWGWVRSFWFRLVHLGAIAVIVLQAWLGRLCPLTIWERELRRAAGQALYQESFVEHWLGRMLYFDLPWWVFLVSYTAFGLLVVWAWWRYPPRRQTASQR